MSLQLWHQTNNNSFVRHKKVTEMCPDSKKYSTIVLLDKIPVYNTKCLILWQPWESRSGYLFSGFPDYLFAPGTQAHLHVPGATEGRGSVFKAHSAGHPLKCGGNLRCKRAHMEPNQWDSWEGRWGKKNIQNPKEKNSFVSYLLS